MSKKPTIKILDSVHCKADKKARRLLLPILQYESTSWKRGKYGHKESQIVTSHLITGREGTAGTFLTGLLPRIKKALGNKIKIIGKEESIKPNKKAHLKGIIFRPDQRRVFRAVRLHPRGRITAPTGSGKTLVALGIMSMFTNNRTLFLCHTKDLIFQTKEEIEKRFPKRKLFIIGAGYKANWNKIHKAKKPLVLSTIQSLSEISAEEYIDFFDITIVDEEHHINKPKSQYGKVMIKNLSPLKYGLTATEPTKKYESLINEGIIGPTIAILTMKEGIEKGIVAKPIVNLVPVPYDIKTNQKCKNKYTLFYEYGIVKNKIRNSLIVNEVKKTIKNKKTTLIIIERKEHGKILQKMLKLKKIKAPFVYGSSEKATRKKVKKNLISGKTKVVICSKVWREGINIPTLNHVINACGMKEEKMVIQAVGRGLRTTKKKKYIKVTDFLDPYRYLAEHSILRIQVYVKQNWL